MLSLPDARGSRRPLASTARARDARNIELALIDADRRRTRIRSELARRCLTSPARCQRTTIPEGRYQPNLAAFRSRASEHCRSAWRPSPRGFRVWSSRQLQVEPCMQTRSQRRPGGVPESRRQGWPRHESAGLLSLPALGLRGCPTPRWAYQRPGRRLGSPVARGHRRHHRDRRDLRQLAMAYFLIRLSAPRHRSRWARAKTATVASTGGRAVAHVRSSRPMPMTCTSATNGWKLWNDSTGCRPNPHGGQALSRHNASRDYTGANGVKIA